MKTLSSTSATQPTRLVWLGVVIIGLSLMALATVAALIFSLWPRPLTVVVVTSTPTAQTVQAQAATATPLPTKAATPLPLWASDPISIPADIPLPPDAWGLQGKVFTSTNSDWPAQSVRTYLDLQTANGLQALDFYIAELPKLGWSLYSDETTTKARNLVFRIGGINELTGYREVRVNVDQGEDSLYMMWQTYPAIPFRADVPVPQDAIAYQYDVRGNVLSYYYLPEADVRAQMTHILNSYLDGLLANGWEFKHGPAATKDRFEFRDQHDPYKSAPEELDCAVDKAGQTVPWRLVAGEQVPCVIEASFRADKPDQINWTDISVRVTYINRNTFFYSDEEVWVLVVEVFIYD